MFSNYKRYFLFAKRQGLNISSMESDFGNAVKAVAEHFLFAEESPIVNNIKIWMVETSGGTCDHVCRRCSISAHALAKHAFAISRVVICVDAYPSFIGDIVSAGMAFVS